MEKKSTFPIGFLEDIVDFARRGAGFGFWGRSDSSELDRRPRVDGVLVFVWLSLGLEDVNGDLKAIKYNLFQFTLIYF